MSCRKVRLVIGVVRKMKAVDALVQLRLINKICSKPIACLIRSAIANAENNFNAKKENLTIKSITADQGPSLKRWRARAFGRAAPIHKHSCHIVVVLEDPAMKKVEKKPAKDGVSEKNKTIPIDSELVPRAENMKIPENAIDTHAEDVEDSKRMGKHRHSQHMDRKIQKGEKGFLKKIFNRKAG